MGHPQHSFYKSALGDLARTKPDGSFAPLLLPALLVYLLIPLGMLCMLCVRESCFFCVRMCVLQVGDDMVFVLLCLGKRCWGVYLREECGGHTTESQYDPQG